ncbi:hypothetical protein MUK42_05645 [Musa troglodytarum]|uniref:Uncharacterized protein n=1 Tax=Musa troglodytarum TaxID=320322 RepID=A0A9E7KC69_9LILI|nr:hypothetical protein MUK42_05645 [Musa troglodytarum]
MNTVWDVMEEPKEFADQPSERVDLDLELRSCFQQKSMQIDLSSLLDRTFNLRATNVDME